jgi:hypothetical protein
MQTPIEHSIMEFPLRGSNGYVHIDGLIQLPYDSRILGVRESSGYPSLIVLLDIRETRDRLVRVRLVSRGQVFEPRTMQDLRYLDAVQVSGATYYVWIPKEEP